MGPTAPIRSEVTSSIARAAGPLPEACRACRRELLFDIRPSPPEPLAARTGDLPIIIQGGMGIGVSNWRLANAVSSLGQLGVVSGTALDTVLARRLQAGDVGGHMRRAMEHFPFRQAAADALKRYFHPEGLPPGTPYATLPMHQQVMSHAREQFTMLAAFVEVQLAREGHDGLVGINLLTKVQMPNLALLYGAMLAGVGFVLMGAGIPREIPQALDALALHRPAALRMEVEGAAGEVRFLRLDPREHWAGLPREVVRPRFLPIVASHSLATMLARKATGAVDGFVIERPTAGGHNAPPRAEAPPDALGNVAYGPRDEVDLEKIRALALPFWLAGATGSPQGLRDARAAGAAGIQVGTLFACCDESGIAEDLRRAALAHAARGELRVRTDGRASPTGYPFKVVTWGETIAERARFCDLGYLRSAYAMPDGRLGYRCPAEPRDAYVAKGGDPAQTPGRVCLCNSLLATIGQAQLRKDGRLEPPLLTGGDDLARLGTFLDGRTHYSAGDVISYLLGGVGG
jgi:nitronate monooxygenase